MPEIQDIYDDPAARLAAHQLVVDRQLYFSPAQPTDCFAVRRCTMVYGIMTEAHEVQAVIAGREFRDAMRYPPGLYIAFLAVQEEQGRQGYGSDLLMAAEDHARALGAATVRLTAATRKARDFYTLKHNYSKWGADCIKWL